MNSYKQTKTLTESDAAYIAGLVDGEGTVTLIRKHKNEHRQLSLSISSTELPLLDFVKSATGVGKITTKNACSGFTPATSTNGNFLKNTEFRKHL